MDEDAYRLCSMPCTPALSVQLPSADECDAIIHDRKLTAIVYFLDETFEELTYDVTTTVLEAVEQLAGIIKLQNYTTFTLYESRRVRCSHAHPVVIGKLSLHAVKQGRTAVDSHFCCIQRVTKMDSLQVTLLLVCIWHDHGRAACCLLTRPLLATPACLLSLLACVLNTA